MSCRTTGKQSGLAAGKNKWGPGSAGQERCCAGLVGYLGRQPGLDRPGPGEEANGPLRAANVLPAGTLASPLRAVTGES